jgi:iron complex outermembrane receptor protein
MANIQLQERLAGAISTTIAASARPSSCQFVPDKVSIYQADSLIPRAFSYITDGKIMEQNTRWLCRLCLLVISSLVSPVLLAATDEGADLGMGDESMLFMDIPSVYSASKYEQSLSDAPAWVTIITGEEIVRYGHRTLDDILESVPGFYTTNDRNYNYLGARGFGRPGDYNSRILLLLDGIRTNDAVGGAAAIGREFLVDVDLIDRVEITRGPGSSLYGTNAFLGVINVITKRGRDLQATEVAGSYGSQDTKEGRLSYGNRLENGFEMLLSGTGFETDGDDHLYYPGLGVARDMDSENSDSLFAKLGYQDFTLQAAYSSRDKQFPTGAWGTLFNDPRNKTKDELYFLNLTYDHTFGNQMEFRGDLNYQEYDYDGDYVFDYNEPFPPPDVVVNKDWSDAEWWGAEGQLTMNQFDRHKLIVGAEYRDNRKQDQGNYDIYGVYLDDHRDSSSYGVYVQDEIALRDDLTLYAGLRYDDYETFGSTTNPRLSLVYRLKPETTVKLLYGTAFRAPTAYEYYYHDDFFTTKPPTDLDPEEIETYELVLEQFIGSNLRAVATLYYYEIDDLIELVTDPVDGLLVFDNASETIEAKGLEMELEGKWEGGWQGRFSYTLQDTEDKATGDTLSNSPKHLVKANLVAPLLDERLFAGAELQFTSKRDAVRGKELDEFTVANLTLSAPNVWKNLDLSASIYNVFDEEYDDPGSEEHLQDGIEQDGRLYRLKLSYQF